TSSRRSRVRRPGAVTAIMVGRHPPRPGSIPRLRVRRGRASLLVRGRKGTGMTLTVVGAGLGRTGTHSLKIALEQLLGGPCYHMIEVFGRPDDVPRWQRAVDGDPGPWDDIFGSYVAAVD